MNRIQFNIGNKTIGNSRGCLIQSMSDIKTSKTEENITMTKELIPSGLDMMRFSVLDIDDAKALKVIKDNIDITIIADIHFDYRLALLALDAGVDKVRINPGNMQGEAHIREIIDSAKRHGAAIRIGINSGSLNRYRGKTDNQEDDIFLALNDMLSIFKEEHFEKLVLSLKTSDPLLLESLYRRAYKEYEYPLHLGLTESGFSSLGSIRSAISIYPLLKDGIGDTIRVSLSDNRIEEIRACKELLRLSNRRSDIPELIVCPGCGRTLIPLNEISRIVLSHLDHIFKKIKVAVMGCPVNGIGEAKDADYGIAGSGKENIFLLFSKGKEIGLFEKEEALNKLFSLIDNY